MADSLQKYVALIPLHRNDGTPVEAELLLDFKERLFLLADGWTVTGTVEGAYRMADGTQQIDHSLQFWIWIPERRHEELRQVVAELGAKLGQESMYLEHAHGTLDFVEPSSDTDEDER
jgi:hypothetical protein